MGVTPQFGRDRCEAGMDRRCRGAHDP